MRTVIAIVAISFCLTGTAFAQFARSDLSPDKMERSGLSFSVQATALTNATRFAVTISCTKRRVSLPKTYYATLRTETEPPAVRTEIINGHPVVTRPLMKNEKGDVINPAITNQTGRIVYSFEVPDEKLADAFFMFWMPNPPKPKMIPESCCRIGLNSFTKKREKK